MRRGLKRVWPVIVFPDGIFQSPILRAHVLAQGSRCLDFNWNDVPAAVMPLLLLDVEELELLMGIVSEGESLVRVLERKASPQWIDRDLKAWHFSDPGRLGTGECRFADSEVERCFRGMVHALKLPPPRAERQQQVAA